MGKGKGKETQFVQKGRKTKKIEKRTKPPCKQMAGRESHARAHTHTHAHTHDASQKMKVFDPPPPRKAVQVPRFISFAAPHR